ncbi:uncharacterized protein IL334_006948 [Kwoniella shivajii]|uniref:Uncharacterized protein n=1 Tax=Kwoniella shivajii TaxID=564305 RepID=A0ABZ1DBB5_9TREE|nr:hypothetical protein IL334_006948 [Kwoniella shivajii]
MPGFFSLPYMLGALVALGVAQACYYYVYLESPTDYYYRYCNVGCAGMDQNDENFNQCCLPMTSGQTAPAVCETLSASCSAAGTTCTWGSAAVPTSTQPSAIATAPADYTPPAVSARSAPPSTSTVWVTQTTTTPCATPTPPPTTSQASVPTSAPEECVCGETSQAAAATTSTKDSEGDAPSADDLSRPKDGLRRRGIMIRNECVCPSSSAAPAPTTAPAPAPAPAPPAEEICDCGETSQAAVPTTSTKDSEGDAPSAEDLTRPIDGRRRRGMMIRDKCVCPSSSSSSVAPVPTTAPAPVVTTAPSPTTDNAGVPTTAPAPSECVCGTTGIAAVPATTKGNEGDVPSADDLTRPKDDERRRGIMIRDECVCPTSDSAPAPAETSSCEESKDSASAPATTPNGEGSTPLARALGARNTPRGENHKRETNPVVTVTSTSMVTTDDCAPSTSAASPPATTENASVPTTSTQDHEGALPDPTETHVGSDPSRKKRNLGRWRDF